MKINCALASRSLIALLFVVAGVQKMMGFAGTVDYINSLGVPVPVLATILVIIIEVPVALAFAWGYRVCVTGMILIGFTLLATILAHNPWAASVDPMMFKNVLMAALKNIAIMGGIMAVVSACSCKNCKGDKKCADCMSGKSCGKCSA